MRNVIHNSITIILTIGILFFFSQKDSLNNEINFKKKIIEFITAEDSREIKKILTYYQFPILNYWNKKNLSRDNVKEIYLSNWRKNKISKNEIQNIKVISKYQYLLTTKYDYSKSLKSKNINSIISEIQFTFNKASKITSIENISIRKITDEDILSPNFINELNERQNFLSKKTLLIKYILIILLILNLILQLLYYIKQLRNKKKRLNIDSIKYQDLKSNKYHYKDLKYEEEFNNLLEEEKNKKNEKSTKYHYKKVNHEEKFNQKLANEKRKEEEEIKENIRRQNANREIRRQEEIRKQNAAAAKKKQAEKRRKEQEIKENIRRQNANREVIRQEEIRKQEEENLRMQNVAAAKKKQAEKARKEKKELENLRKKNEKEKKLKTVEIKRVNYSTSKVTTSTTQYPIIRKPEPNSIIRSFRLGRNNRKGYKEEEFFNAIKNHFYKNFDIIDNAMLAIGKNTTPYEPDIAMISTGTKNIYIDIEIDEPYAGVSRKLTHCYPEDVNRDNYFVDRGWLVIRFSEYQVHHQINYCLYQIVKVISLIDYNFKIGSLAPYRSIDKEKCWNTIQARNWEILNYREKYLNHNFKPYRERKRTINTSLTKEEQLEENLVKSTRPKAPTKPTRPKRHSIPTNTIEPKVYAKPTRKVVTPIPKVKKEYNSSNTPVVDLIKMAINNGYAIEMNYTNYNGESSLRKISKIEYTKEFMTRGYPWKSHIKGYCHKRHEERSFKVSRINYMKILN